MRLDITIFFLKRKDHVELSIPEKHKIRNHGCKQKTSKEMTWGEVGGDEITIIYSMIFFQKKKPKTKNNSIQITANLDFILRTESFVLK